MRCAAHSMAHNSHASATVAIIALAAHCAQITCSVCSGSVLVLCHVLYCHSLAVSDSSVVLSCCSHPFFSTVSGSTVTVRCISSGTLPESFSVSLAIESGATGCRASASATTQVTLSGCCVSGANTDTAFATVQTGEQLVAASNPGRAACFLDTAAGPWPSDCSMRWGWRNEFTGPGELTANLYAGAAKGCKNLNKLVGTMKVTCANDGGNARVVLWKPDNFGIMPPDNHYYVSWPACFASCTHALLAQQRKCPSKAH